MDPTKRFSTRVADYVKARPGYPPRLMDVFREYGLAPPCAVADAGSGTGILTGLLLKHGYEVFAVEPNLEMRQAAEQALGDATGFHSIVGRAEATGLPDRSVDFITVAQAFHWFDRDKTQQEFRRILRAGGWVFLMWNSRLDGVSEFMQTYEQLLKDYSVDYGRVSHRNIAEDALRDFFDGGEFRELRIPNTHHYDCDRLRSGLLSSSYTPQKEDSRYEPMLRKLEEIFCQYERDGRIAYELETQLYCGRLLPGAS